MAVKTIVGITNMSLFIVIASTAALGFAALVYRCVEYPARDLLRRIMDGGKKAFVEIEPPARLQLESLLPFSPHSQ